MTSLPFKILEIGPKLMNPKDFKGLPYSKWDIDQDTLINSLPLEIRVKRRLMTLQTSCATFDAITYKLHIETWIDNSTGEDHQVIHINYSADFGKNSESIFYHTYSACRNLDTYFHVIKHLIKLHE